ncbi:MAG TPA: hypothetical protein V6D08_01225 [Candidatus Obscuribacterales bacterium]
MTGQGIRLVTAEMYPAGNERLRTFALFYFVILLTVWVIAGHLVLGFEQAWIQPVVSVATACAVQVLLDVVDSLVKGRPSRLAGGWLSVATLIIPAWISGLAIGMLLWPNKLLLPLVLAASLAIASKVVFRAPYGSGTQHIYNPSNFGLTVVLFLCPWVSIAPPYHFTENVVGIWNWIVPGLILVSGIVVHTFCTGRLPLVGAWLCGFVTQALIRHYFFGASFWAPLVPMTSAAFVLFTLYMIPDPATTPIDTKRQIAFGLSVAAVYALFQISHQVYGLFGALLLVSTIRGIGLWLALPLHGRRTEGGKA